MGDVLLRQVWFNVFVFYVVFLDQSDSFFHCQCLECPALADRPCVGRCAGNRDVDRVRGETYGAGAWRGSGPGNALLRGTSC